MNMLFTTKAIPKEIRLIVDKPMAQIAAARSKEIVLYNTSADQPHYNLAAMATRFNEHKRSKVLEKRMPGDLFEYSVIKTEYPLDAECKISRIIDFIEKPDQVRPLESDCMAV